MYYERSLTDVWLDANRQFPVLLLTGPRQVGKTTFLQHTCEEGRTYVTLDDPDARTLAIEDPALFLSRFEAPLLIDEIQYAPQLLPFIKIAADTSQKAGQFWLTGSQHFLMMKNVSESLAGRVAILNLLGFSHAEQRRQAIDLPPFLPGSQNLEERLEQATRPNLKRVYKSIWQGAFPALIAGPAKNRDLYYSAYMQTYLQRDVRDLAQVGNEMAFAKFVRACAARTAQLLNLSDLAKDVDISVPTAKHWLSVLQASFQVHLLQPYHSNLTKRLIKTPKLYFMDTGLCAYLTAWSDPVTLEAGAMSGAIFETYVFSEILKSYWHRGLQPRLYFYRDKDGREIDFLLEQNQTLYPIEVKKSATVQRQWTKAFSVLERLKCKVGPGIILCMTGQRLPLDEQNQAIPISVL